MWFWLDELKSHGFRRRSEHLWLCYARYGLSGPDHLSIYDWSPPGALRLEIQSFHVTFQRAGHNLHVYYRELEEARWAPEGYTDARLLHDLGLDRRLLLGDSDRIVLAFTEAIGALLLPRPMI